MQQRELDEFYSIVFGTLFLLVSFGFGLLFHDAMMQPIPVHVMKQTYFTGMAASFLATLFFVANMLRLMIVRPHRIRSKTNP